MKLTFTGKNLEITPALKSLTEKKLQALEKHFERINQINVVLHIENVTQVAEATAHMNGAEIHAKAESNDMYNAIDIMIDKLTTQIVKHKEKLIDSHR
jgi:ribosome hibernation promoting factor